MSPDRRFAKIPVSLVAVFVAFVLFGLTHGVSGTVWPTQRIDLGRAIGDLSLLVVGYTLGALAATTASGHVTARWGTSRGMMAAASLMALGLAGIGVAPGFWAVVASTAAYGAGAGLLDSVVNALVTVRHGARVMGFLHAFFGIGGILGPLAAAGALEAGLGWRVVYVLMGAAAAAVLGLVWRRRRDYDTPIERQTVTAAGSGHPAATRLLRLSLLWFFVIVGLEGSVASWSFSLLVEQRGLAEPAAAVWVASFWGTFTVGRVAMGVLGDRLPLMASLRGSVALTGAGAILMWLNLGFLPAGISLPIFGIGGALLFPLMVLITPQWLGAKRTGRAVGYQLSASSLGAVTFAVAIGRLADRFDLEVLGPSLLTGAAVLGVLLFVMERTVSDQILPTRSVGDAIAGSDPFRNGLRGRSKRALDR